MVRHRKYRFTVRETPQIYLRPAIPRVSMPPPHQSETLVDESTRHITPPPTQGVVAGWDRGCRRPAEWVQHNRIAELPEGAEAQPFYTVLPVRICARIYTRIYGGISSDVSPRWRKREGFLCVL